MMIKVIDFLGRILTVSEISKFLIKASNKINEAQQNRIQKVIEEFKEKGFHPKEAEIWALWTLGYLDADPTFVINVLKSQGEI